MKPKVIIVTGCRPDIIKTWPVYKALSTYPHLETIVVQSGQHDKLATQAFNNFGFWPNIWAEIADEDKLELGYLHSALVKEFTKIFKKLEPSMVLVHGDTTTAFSGSTAAFLRNIPIGHIEAGLRTSRFEYPFPEEGYRRAISRLTTLHFAPTMDSANNLYLENIYGNVHLTGNTIVDSLKYILGSFQNELSLYLPEKKVILVTAHRRETYGSPLKELCNTLKTVAYSHEDYNIIWPVHNNPNVHDTVHRNLDGITNIKLIDPVSYLDFVKLMDRANIVITDSGGVLEECAVMQKPTLILRTEIERPECLGINNIKLIGYDFERLLDTIKYWNITLPKQKKELNNLLGDGTAGIKIAQIIDSYFKGGANDNSI